METLADVRLDVVIDSSALLISSMQTLADINPDVAIESYTMNITTLEVRQGRAALWSCTAAALRLRLRRGQDGAVCRAPCELPLLAHAHPVPALLLTQSCPPAAGL